MAPETDVSLLQSSPSSLSVCLVLSLTVTLTKTVVNLDVHLFITHGYCPNAPRGFNKTSQLFRMLPFCLHYVLPSSGSFITIIAKILCLSLNARSSQFTKRGKVSCRRFFLSLRNLFSTISYI